MSGFFSSMMSGFFSSIECRPLRLSYARRCLRNLPCGPAVRLAYRKVQARQKQLAVIGVSQIADIGDYNIGHGTQPKDDVSRIVEPAHSRSPGQSIAIGPSP